MMSVIQGQVTMMEILIPFRTLKKRGTKSVTRERMWNVER